MYKTNSEHYKMLARFFGNAASVRVEFIKDGTPKTDGKIIYLPENLRGHAATLTLAALLHESQHVAKTCFDPEYLKDITPAVHNCLNVLEDIRIDFLTREEYPNAQQLQNALINDVIKQCGDALKEETPPMQILKALIMRAAGVDTSNVYGETVNKVVKMLDVFIDHAKKAKNTQDLLEDARTLTRLLWNAQPSQSSEDGQESAGQQTSNESGSSEDGQESAGQQTSNESGSSEDGQESAGQQTSNESGSSEDGQESAGQQTSNESGSSEDGDEELMYPPIVQKQEDAPAGDHETSSNEKEKYNNAAKNADKARKEKESAEEKASAAALKENARAKEVKTARRKARLYSTKAYRADNEKDRKRYEELKAKNEQDYDAAYDKYRAARDERYNAQNEAYRAESTERAELHKMEDAETSYFGDGCGVSLTGFDAITKESLKNMTEDEETAGIDGGASLDDIVKDALIIKKDKEFADESGAKLNLKTLPALAAGIDSEEVFLTTDDAQHKTRIAFIIDGSGSMGNYYPINQKSEYTERATLAIESAAVLLDAIKKAIDSGAPADFDVYAFGGNVVELMDGCDNYTRAALVKKYNAVRDRRADWTRELNTDRSDLLQAVNITAEDLKEKAQDGARVIVIITDANVMPTDLKALRNGSILDGERVVFIGANVETLGNEDAAALFGDYNIIDYKTAPDIITRALLAAI